MNAGKKNKRKKAAWWIITIRSIGSISALYENAAIADGEGGLMTISYYAQIIGESLAGKISIIGLI